MREKYRAAREGEPLKPMSRLPNDENKQATKPHRVQRDRVPRQSRTTGDGTGHGEAPTQALLAEKLDAAREAAQLGNRERAFQLSLEATRMAPKSVEAWLYCAALVSNSDERLAYLTKALSLAPQDVQAGRGMYATLNQYLKADPFLRYLEENDLLYRVVTGEGRVVAVPKDRTFTPLFPASEPHVLRATNRWLAYALVGLFLAGLGTLVCAPIAAAFAWRARHELRSADQRSRADLALIYAAVLWMFGLLFSFLLLLHL